MSPIAPSQVPTVEDRRTTRHRGRPRVYTDDVLLEAAFKAFAESGYEGMSVRTVAEELGLSHGALNRRFGSKLKIFERAIAHGFETLFAAMAAEQAARPAPDDDLALLREFIRASIVVNEHRPEFSQLMTREGQRRTPQLELILQRGPASFMPAIDALKKRLEDAGLIYPITTRALFFLVTHGSDSVFSMKGLSSYFDDLDGPLNAEEHIEAMTDLIMRGLTR